MDPGTYMTNAILINSVTSIPYVYLEPITKPTGSSPSLRGIESLWRENGALVVCDPSKFGLWIFGNESGGDPYSRIPSSCVIHKDGSVETHGVKFTVETRGNMDPSAVKSPHVLHNPASTKSMSAVSSSPREAIRNAQIMNARAAQLNSAVSAKHGQLPSPVNTAILSVETLDSSAKILQLFVSAVLGSTSYLLCHNHGLIPLNARTLTRPSHQNSKDSYSSSLPMLTIDVTLTPLGNLILKTTCHTSSVLSFVTTRKENDIAQPNIDQGELVLLAPGAITAKYLVPCSENSITNLGGFWGFGQNAAIKTKKWQQQCRSWLADSGIDSSLLENCSWLMVQVPSTTFASQSSFRQQDTPNNGFESLTFPWPAELCFVRQGVAYESLERIRGTVRAGSRLPPQDPLVFAEQWFSSKAERELNISKRQQNRDAENIAKSQAESQTKATPSNTYTYSQVAARRNSATGVYPTPPDGVQVMPGATPNFDGTSSTPGNLNHPTPLNAEASVAARDDTSNEPWSSTNAPKETQVQEFPANDESDLFGEMNIDVFGDNDITDADFNFFDEPDKMLDVPVDDTEQLVINEPDTAQAAEPHEERDSDIIMNDIDEDETTGNTGIKDEFPTSSSTKLQIIPVSNVIPPIEGDHQMGVAGDVKRDIAPILSPDVVFRKLFPRPDRTAPQNKKDSSGLVHYRPPGQFASIGFDAAMLAVNDKYSSNGRFGYVGRDEITRLPSPTTIPETEYLSAHTKRPKIAPHMRILTSIPPSATPQIDISSNGALINLGDSFDRNYKTESDISDPDDLSPLSEQSSIGFAKGTKRKRDLQDENDSQLASSVQDLAEEHTSDDVEEPMPIALDSDPVDWPLNDFLSLPQPYPNSVTDLSDSEYIAAAQIITDQVTSSTIPISILMSDGYHPLSADFLDEKTIVNKAQKDLAAVAKLCFTSVESCSLSKFLSIPGFHSVNQILRTQARQQVKDGSVQLQLSNPFPLKTPYLEVRRSDSKLTLLPSAIPFWGNLGLGPNKGVKDIKAVCVLPDHETMLDSASAFLETLRGAYESAKLGLHDRIDISGLGFEETVGHGLVSIDLSPQEKDQASEPQPLTTIKRTLHRLGRALASVSVEEKNIVVYFIYSPDQEDALPLVCSGFYDLKESYERVFRERKAEIRNYLVLQLIPKRFVTSNTAIVIPSPTEYSHLALEVYDRCADFQSPSFSPSILLEQPLPERIDFKLAATPSVSLLDENCCIHVAYAQSIDDRWISAAWTDSRGGEQMTASYCLGRKNRPASRNFLQVAEEIWKTTLDVISHTPVNWRIMLAKSGVMDRSEIDIWSSLASTETSASVTLFLLTVKSQPSLQLLPQATLLSPNTLSAQSGMLTTPVSTPQALSILSPDTPARDPIASASTPDATTVEPPLDGVLVDITDQSWGSILGHDLQNSNSLLEQNPAVLSGYLIKRGGTRPDDTPTLVEINIVSPKEGFGSTRAYEHLLKEVLGMYNGLGILAKARGVVDPARNLPWHIAAVEKAVKVLYVLM